MSDASPENAEPAQAAAPAGDTADEPQAAANEDDAAVASTPAEGEVAAKGHTIAPDSDSDDDEPATKAAEAPADTAALFGSDASDDDDESPDAKPEESTKAKTKEDLFGSDSEDSDDGGKPKDAKTELLGEISSDEEQDDAQVAAPAPEIEPEQKEATKPMFSTKIGRDLTLVKMPNFLSIMQRPFDPQLYDEDELEPEIVVDEVGRRRVKLKFGNVLRWRYKKDAAGNDMQDEGGNYIRESNARYVKWSDGTHSVVLGKNVADARSKDMAGEHNCLFQLADAGINAVEVFEKRMKLVPATLTSSFHKDLTNEVAQFAGKRSQIQMTAPIEDPEKAVEERQQRAKAAEKLRMKEEADARRSKEALQSNRRAMRGQDLESGAESEYSSDDGERPTSKAHDEDFSTDQGGSSGEEETSPKKAKKAKRPRTIGNSDDESEPESPAKAKKPRNISDSDDSD